MVVEVDVDVVVTTDSPPPEFDGAHAVYKINATAKG